MLYIHASNFDHKIDLNYKGKREAIKKFKNDYYIPMRNTAMSLEFNEKNRDSFEKAAELFNRYYDKMNSFIKQNEISSQSKFASTFLEELSVYLFKDIPSIKNNTFDIYNKGVYAGIKLSGENEISIVKKDVDFCIGKNVHISIDGYYQGNIIIPLIAVEVKTYLDATMFGEIKSSSKAIRSATPNASTYVLMGYRDLAEEHLIAARQDATLTEMFALSRSKQVYIEADALYAYWSEINNVVNSIKDNIKVPSVGRLLFPENRK